MPTYFSGDQKCKNLFRLILNVINTGGKDQKIYDGFLTKKPFKMGKILADDPQHTRKKSIA